MDFSRAFTSILASVIIVARRSVALIFYPYKTMREIAREDDFLQIGILFTIILIYYLGVNTIRDTAWHPLIQFLFVGINYTGTIFFTYIFAQIHRTGASLRPYFFLFSYAMIPTIIWFYMNSLLYVALPPPRNITLTGKVFSLVFITLSVSLLTWKILLWYLAVRYATRLKFYDILLIGVLFFAFLLPYALLLYNLSLFRIPFI
ncbi:MAG: hypothetical protein N2691_00235 [Patescibacteria group bacterium]|nr:hypothetical protein [Patescibacteria group bacterium]